MRIAYLSIVLSVLLAVTAAGESPVDFPDVNLKAAVEEALWTLDPTPTDMLGLTTLTSVGSVTRNRAIVNLTGLEYALNLQSLTLRFHLISDISALSGLTNLSSLDLKANKISDISPLATLANLETLSLEMNSVSNISVLSSLTKLDTINLHRNQIGDISSLASMTWLAWCDLRINPLNREAYESYIDEIFANNPGIWFVYDPHFERRVIVESTRGGSVTDPGEGAFTYEFGEYIWLIAEADPCFAFVCWSGKFGGSSPVEYLLVDQDYELLASFRSTLETIHVDDDAPGDPGPGDLAVSDAQENGTAAHPFDRVQEAIDVAAPGARVLVHAGTYHENINLLGKSISLVGIDPNDPNVADYPVLVGHGVGPVVSFYSGEDPNCRVTGFRITGGRNEPATALYCHRSSPTISNCLIVGNRSARRGGAGISCIDSAAVFVNCTITDNYAGEGGTGIDLQNSDVTLLNCIVRGNLPQDITVDDDSQPSVRHSNITGSWPLAGNMDQDPLFAARGYWVDRQHPEVPVDPSHSGAVWIDGDYHVKSQAGRWDALGQVWVVDSVTSPCVDGGSPESPLAAESLPHGGRVNLGAYGGTAWASKSP